MLSSFSGLHPFSSDAEGCRPLCPCQRLPAQAGGTGRRAAPSVARVRWSEHGFDDDGRLRLDDGGIGVGKHEARADRTCGLVEVIEEAVGPRIATTIGGKPFSPPALPEQKLKNEKPARGTRDAARENISKVEPSVDLKIDAEADPLVTQMAETAALNAKTHEAYLQFAGTMERTLTQNIALQMSLMQRIAANGAGAGDWGLEAGEMQEERSAKNQSTVPSIEPPAEELREAQNATSQPPVPSLQSPILNREMCMEFAVGSIARVLGPEFAEVDSYPTRVRLPDEPLMLVDRIITIEGEPRSMTGGRVVTEHDVTADRWYLDGGRIPTCIAVEAGQADLFLSAYLGIDFRGKGKAVYRLLDALVTFHRGLPVPGDVIRYDIKIDHFFRQDQTYLFRFNFEGTVNGEPLLSMKNGCAGFFTVVILP